MTGPTTTIDHPPTYTLADAVRALTTYRQSVQARTEGSCPNFPRVCLCVVPCYAVAEVAGR